MKQYKILFCDLDGTLIEPISKNALPMGIWDMRIKLDVLTAIKTLAPEYVFIVSNQELIEKGIINERNFQFKSEYIRRCLCEYLNIDLLHCDYQYCKSNNSDCEYRKPNIGMLTHLTEQYIQKKCSTPQIANADCLMIGNESGKYTFSDVDKKNR